MSEKKFKRLEETNEEGKKGISSSFYSKDMKKISYLTTTKITGNSFSKRLLFAVFENSI
jgi:hypothetical protein